MNACHFIGRLTAAPTIKYENGEAICKFFLAVKRDRNGNSDFVPFAVWGGYAESLANNLKKGQQIGVTARFVSTNYTDDYGKKSVFYEFRVQTVEFLD